jgi:threonine/homoserine/homoserine lactone efflux protein
VTELLLGLSLGLAAGMSPGPLMTLTITTALQRGLRAGLRVALSPLVTDAPIIALCVLVLSALPKSLESILGVLGGLFVVYIGLQTILESRHAKLKANPSAQTGSQDLLRGVMVNLLSPHPWLFWIGIGAPTLVKAGRTSWTNGIAFLVGFYVLLIGIKMLAAFLASHGRRFLTGPWYSRVLIGSGVLLIALGVVLAFEGLRKIIQV